MSEDTSSASPRDEVTRLGMWSGPRNISTAMMRAWENRPDTVVVDEPFYAAYLSRTGIDHPGRAAIIDSQPVHPEEVVRRLRDMPFQPFQPSQPLGGGDGGADRGGRRPGVAYAKHMSHHMLARDDLTWTLGFHNVLLIRDPAEVVASYVHARESCEPEDIGIPQQARLWRTWQEAGLDVPVIDTADFLADPEAHLRWICAWLDIDFMAEMLSWRAGPRDSDGVWAPHWYASVLASTGFSPRAARVVDLDQHDRAVADACRPDYEMLREQRLRV
ncbi:MAG: HAD family hydrolase [Ornithinimicrobium sp.]